MAGRSQRTEWILFRSIVVPVFFVTMFFRKTALQWLALGVLAAWLLLSVFLFFKRRAKRQSKKVAVRERREHNDALPAELNLIRQVNYRITELLKQSYPAVAWLWDKRPTAEEIGRGGAWRILMEHADPFNYAEITIEINGAMHMRELKSWVQSVMITKDPYESALSTVIASASADPDNRAELISSCLRPQYTETI